MKTKIALDVRAQNKSGYIITASGGGDSLSLRIKPNGKLTATCNNGGGKWSVTVDPPTSICNGEFHSILLLKDKKTLTLTVDGTTETETTSTSSSSADTNSPLYFGGMPDAIKPKNYNNFSGCLTAVKINDQPVDFVNDVAITGATMRGCPEV